jgi:hypothetical protein
LAAPDPALSARIVDVWDLPGVGAGSGLIRAAGALIAVQDDAPAAARIDPDARTVALMPLAPDATRMAKRVKPDLEAIAAGPDGALWIFGSGSAEKRRRIARLEPATGAVTWQDAGALYDAVAAAIGETPNLEGAAAHGGGLRLFHRGAGGSCRNWVVDVALGPGGPSGPVRGAFEVDLGEVAGVPFSFTDAAALPGGRFLYLAAAEDTPDAIADGPVVGAAIGLLDGTAVRWTPIREADGTPSVRKAEGLAPDPDLGGAWLITDPDDEARPAQLVRVVLEGPWG